MSLIIFSCRKTRLIMPLKLSHTNLFGFVPFLVLCYPIHSSSGFSGWTTVLVQQDLMLVNPFWLFPVACSFMCPEMHSKRIYSFIFPDLASVLHFFTFFRILNPVPGSWQPILQLIIPHPRGSSCVSELQIQLCVTSYRPILYQCQQAASGTLQKSLSTACVLPCCLCWRCQGSCRPLWEQGSDTETSSHYLKKASSTSSLDLMWYMHSVSCRHPQHPAA